MAIDGGCEVTGKDYWIQGFVNRLEALWCMSHGLSVIDQGNNYFLVRFKRDSNTQHALIKDQGLCLATIL